MRLQMFSIVSLIILTELKSNHIRYQSFGTMPSPTSQSEASVCVDLRLNQLSPELLIGLKK